MPTYEYNAFACYVPIPEKCRTCMNLIVKTYFGHVFCIAIRYVKTKPNRLEITYDAYTYLVHIIIKSKMNQICKMPT